MPNSALISRQNGTIDFYFWNIFDVEWLMNQNFEIIEGMSGIIHNIVIVFNSLLLSLISADPIDNNCSFAFSKIGTY